MKNLIILASALLLSTIYFEASANPCDSLICDDSNTCTFDECDSISGCLFTVISCDDFDACTIDDCDPLSGCRNNPVDCDDMDSCTMDFCDGLIGCNNIYDSLLCGPNICDTINCDDSDACTTDGCDPLTGCTSTAIVCDDGDLCTTDNCDFFSGCFFDTIPGCDNPCDSLICDDGNACTVDTCINGNCIFTPIVCNDADVCTTDACVNGVCQFTAVICNDGDVCTTEVCDSLVGCTYTPNVCGDGDACTTDGCDPITGCNYTPVVCDDQNICTNDTCDSVAGCGASPIFPCLSDTISGVVYLDANANCVRDSGEAGIANVLIDVTPGGGSFTDANGMYLLVVDSGSYVVSQVVPQYQNQLCPVSPNTHSVVFNAYGLHSSGNDFANETITIQDLQTSLFCGVVRPGFQENISFTIHNAGTIAMSGYAKFALDSRLTYAGVSWQTPAPDNIDAVNNWLYWNFINLGISQSLTFSFYAQVPPPPQVTINNIIFHAVTAYPLIGDADSADNNSTCAITVTGSYDPNDKAVSPAGDILPEDTLMYYTIRFQNTGTDTAFNVVVKDTLDSNLDYTTFRLGTASHEYSVHFENDDVVVFTFANILLPDSNVNEPASHGHVTFYIEHNGILPLGTAVSNRAAIYFDFNEPVITNTVTTTVQLPVGVSQFHSLSDNIRIYPNPAQDVLTVKAREGILRQIFIADLMGKRVYDSGKVNVAQQALRIEDLMDGVYLLQIQTTTKQIIKKLIVSR